MEREWIRRVLSQAALLFVAATALGLVYNSASPLGVRIRVPSAASAHTGASIYSNETLALAPQTNRAVPNSRIQNETVSVAVLPTSAAPPPKNIQSMTWPQVKAMSDKVIIVDAREPVAFDAGHVPNAISLPTRLLRDKIDKFMADVPRDKTIVVYCVNAQCPLSRNLAHALAEQYGYTDVREVPGGYTEWLANEATK